MRIRIIILLVLTFSGCEQVSQAPEMPQATENKCVVEIGDTEITVEPVLPAEPTTQTIETVGLIYENGTSTKFPTGNDERRCVDFFEGGWRYKLCYRYGLDVVPDLVVIIYDDQGQWQMLEAAYYDYGESQIIGDVRCGNRDCILYGEGGQYWYWLSLYAEVLAAAERQLK